MPNCVRCGTHVYLVKLGDVCMDCEEMHAEDEKAKRLSSIVMTTSIDVPGQKIERVISIVAAEVALAMSIFKDIANEWRDFLGGRSGSSQASLKQARTACLNQLRQEAFDAGADAVIAVDIDYNEISTRGSSGSILMVAATGTAVRLSV